ncbi:MAG: hypothetical protein NTZ42_04710 [Candidatus Gribaldobacteria bacterium]|nr:hypothetical protein [Candidatus Gribaldobacteria bacterium]
MSEDVKEEKEKISKHKFFFELPLYTPIELGDLEKSFWEFFKGDVDAYSPDGFDTTYTIAIWNLGQSDSTYNGYYALNLECKRKGNTLEFFIYKTNEAIMKVGQLLSLVDLQYAEIEKKYDKVLPRQDLHDLKKAIGLMTHGAGAGSLVYLRRIFENIIWNTYKEYKASIGVADEEFLKKRMDEKVDFLKTFLPSQLVEMKSIYGILSKGVHELTEEECLTYFPALKLSIILILDQKIEEDARSKKDAETKRAIADIAKQINGK